MKNLPEYIKCVERQHAEHKGKAWCGKDVEGFSFQGVDHAAENGLQNGRLVACGECVRVIHIALTNGST
jgi:hypothetical protein